MIRSVKIDKHEKSNFISLCIILSNRKITYIKITYLHKKWLIHKIYDNINLKVKKKMYRHAKQHKIGNCRTDV